MRIKTRIARVTLSSREARLLHTILGQFNSTTCEQLYDNAEELFARFDINSAEDLDRATDELYRPLQAVIEGD